MLSAFLYTLSLAPLRKVHIFFSIFYTMHFLSGILFIALIATITVKSDTEITIQVDKANVITGHQDSKGNLGAVYGLRQCGGPAKLIGWKMDICDTTDTPCRMPLNTNLHSELEFIPSDNIEQLGIRVFYTLEGKEPERVYEVPLQNSSVVGGMHHTIRTQAQVVDGNLKGKMVDAQYILYRVDNGLAEVCAQADLEVY